MALAATILLMFGVVGGGWMWMEQQASDRREVATSKINRAYSDALLHQGLADSADTETQIAELEKALADIELEEVPGEDESLQAQQADALVQVAQSYLAGCSEKSSCTADHYQVMVHVDEEALRGEPKEGSESDLPIETVRRLCCDGAVVAVKEDEKGNPLRLSRKHRVVQPALKRALLARDKCCRYAGCNHEKWLDAHHVVHWADGGETNLDNTVLLCSKHHRLLHEGAFSIRSAREGEFEFRR